MRVLPILTAMIVSVVLYALVMEREALSVFASGQSAGPRSEPQAEQVAAPPPAAETAPDTRRVPVLARMVQAQSVDNAVLLRGRTEAARSVEVRAETSGRVVSEPLRRGAYVNTGDVLCKLDEGTRRATLAEAQARLTEAELNARNAERLTEGGFASETRAVAARAALQGASAGVEAAMREIERLELRAPFPGLLEADAAELGALLQPGTLCATVIQLDPMRLVGFVAETDVDRIDVGAMAGGRLSSGREVVGRVTFLARSADPLTRTFRVEVSVANPDLAIRDGQTVEMLVQTDGVSAHLLPGSALTLDDDGRLGVRIAEGIDDGDSRARFVPVTVIRDTASGIWVRGLPDRAALIVLGQEYVTDGVALDVTLQDPAQ